MSKYKLIAFDMDGTLLNDDKKILPEVAKAVNEACAAGKVVAMSTGRCPCEITEYLEQIPDVRYLISLSGALVYDVVDKKFIFSKMHSIDTMKKLMEITKLEDCMPHIMSVESYVTRSQISMMTEYNKGIYEEMYWRVATPVDNIYEFYDAAPFESPHFNIYHRSEESMKRTYQRILDAGLEVKIAVSEVSGLEINPLNVDKGYALSKLCEHLGIDVSEAIAVGDADNDKDNLKTAGLGIAVANAEPAILEIADAIVPDNNSGGCAEAVYKYLLV